MRSPAHRRIPDDYDNLIFLKVPACSYCSESSSVPLKRNIFNWQHGPKGSIIGLNKRGPRPLIKLSTGELDGVETHRHENPGSLRYPQERKKKKENVFRACLLKK